MDTLLIPVGGEDSHKAARKKAIHQIYTVFSRAKYTIVVDNGLSTMSWDDRDYTTTAMRILASGWMRRLWTLQEAYLSRKLLFAFKHWEEDHDENKDPPLVDLDEIEALYHEDLNEKSFGKADLMKPDNETSQKLDVEARQKLDIETSQKLDKMMKDFWLSLEESSPGAIPPGIIFLPGPRIQITGFGWAPKSWMLAHGPDYPDPVALLTKAAVLSPENGLQVEFPGFLLHCEDRDAILSQTDGQGFRFPCDNSLTEYYRVTWDETDEYSKQRGIIGEQRSEDLAIILCRPRPGQLPEIGLLVEIYTTKQEKKDLGQDSVRRVFAVYMRRRVNVKRETSDLNLDTKVEEIMNRGPKEQSRIICGEILDEDQKWIVDCRIDSTEKRSTEKGASKPPVTAPSALASVTARNVVMGFRSAQDRGQRSGPSRGPPAPSSQSRISGQTLTDYGANGLNDVHAISPHGTSYEAANLPSPDEPLGPGNLQRGKTWKQLWINPWNTSSNSQHEV
ncbi:unnamed protein product [Alternaria alternata]